MATRRQDANAFANELRLAAAVTWYAQGSVSQGRAAEIAGMSRAEFIDALGRFGVSPFQYSSDEIVAEATRARDLGYQRLAIDYAGKGRSARPRTALCDWTPPRTASASR